MEIKTILADVMHELEDVFETLDEGQLRELESHLSAAVELAKRCDLSHEQLHEMLRILSEEEST